MYIGGDYLIDGSLNRSVSVVQSTNRGQTVSTIEIDGINTPIQPTTGQLAGLVTARDTVLGGFQDQLDNFSSLLTNEFNKIYASGQGTVGYSTITSQNTVVNPAQSLSSAGLNLTPVNGSFDITTTNKQSGLSSTTNIPVNLLGTGNDATLNSLAGEINGVAGLQATVSNGQLSINSTDPNVTFAFSNDSSNTLASLGLNTFSRDRRHRTSRSIQMSCKTSTCSRPVLVVLASTRTMPKVWPTSAPSRWRPKMASRLPTCSARLSTTWRRVRPTLRPRPVQRRYGPANTRAAQELSVSGVNLDEETVNLLQYQYSYQASAKVISTVNTLLAMLIQL